MRREISPEPLLLRRPGAHVEVAVQRDDVPGAEVEAVIALARLARRRTEVAEIARSSGGVVVVVAGNRPGAGLVPAPSRIVAVGVFGAGTVRVRIIARREHGAGDRVELVIGEGIPGLVTYAGISGCGEYS